MRTARLVVAGLGFLAGAALHGLNAIISFQERGIVEPFDVPLAIALGVAALLTLLRSSASVLGGAALSVLALAFVARSGATPLIAFWIAVLILALQALPVVRSTRHDLDGG